MVGVSMRSQPTFAIHVDCDNLWIYEAEYGRPTSDDQDLIYTQALPSLMEVFARWNIRATFFVIGRELDRRSCADFCRSALAAGHRIANHSFSHRPDFSKLTSAEKREDIVAADAAITKATGRKPIGFRSPGYHVDPDLVTILQTAGYAYDSSILPGPAGLLMKTYMTLLGRGGNNKSFGPLTSIFSRRQPHAIGDGTGNPLWEFPIATFPFLRLPIHSTFVYKFGESYLGSALRLLKQMSGHHIYLLHAIDGLDDPRPERFKGQVIPLSLPFARRRDFLNSLGAQLQDRVVLTEDLVAGLNA